MTGRRIYFKFFGMGLKGEINPKDLRSVSSSAGFADSQIGIGEGNSLFFSIRKGTTNILNSTSWKKDRFYES